MKSTLLTVWVKKLKNVVIAQFWSIMLIVSVFSFFVKFDYVVINLFVWCLYDPSWQLSNITYLLLQMQVFQSIVINNSSN